jgi:hypothetical protein
LTAEEELITRACTLKERIAELEASEWYAKYAAVVREYESARQQLRGIHLMGIAEGRNAPMRAPGVLITWREVNKGPQAARVEYWISFRREVE